MRSAYFSLKICTKKPSFLRGGLKKSSCATKQRPLHKRVREITQVQHWQTHHYISSQFHPFPDKETAVVITCRYWTNNLPNLHLLFWVQVNQVHFASLTTALFFLVFLNCWKLFLVSVLSWSWLKHKKSLSYSRVFKLKYNLKLEI